MAASNKKFTLTELLNQRSKEVAPMTQQEETKKGSGETTREDIYNLIPSKDNFYSVKDVQDLKQSIELLGILQPLLVTNEDGGKRRIIAGHRRRLAIMQLVEEGKERFRYVPIMVTQQKNAILDRLALIMTNRFREKTDWEKMTEALETEKLVLELKSQMDIPGRTRDLLAEIIETSPAQLGRYKAIYNNLTEELMEEFKAGTIGVSVIYEASGLDEEYQKTAAEIFRENGTLALPDVKALKKKQEDGAQVPGQQSLFMNEPEKSPQEEEKDAGTEYDGKEEENTTEGAGEATEGQQEEWVDPQPETVTSLCYGCLNYETCHEKKATVTSCNAYINRREANKTEAERYEEEQAQIDAETRKKMRDQQQEEKMERGPAEKQHEEIRLAGRKYEEIMSGALSFLLLKKDGYKIGEVLILPEYEDGKQTGRAIDVEVCYIWEDWTGLDDNYCIVGFHVEAWTDGHGKMAAGYADQPILQPGA